MRRLFQVLLLSLFISAAAYSRGSGGGGHSSGGHHGGAGGDYGASNSEKTVHVGGYFKANGHYVHSYWRRPPGLGSDRESRSALSHAWHLGNAGVGAEADETDDGGGNTALPPPSWMVGQSLGYSPGDDAPSAAPDVHRQQLERALAQVKAQQAGQPIPEQLQQPVKPDAEGTVGREIELSDADLERRPEQLPPPASYEFVQSLPSDFPGRCLKVLDGNLLQVVTTGVITIQGRKQYTERLVTFRLYGIACPQLNQPFGPAAKTYVEQQTSAQDMNFHIEGRAAVLTGRAYVLREGRQENLNQGLTRSGLAWRNPAEVGATDALNDFESSARAAKLGLWADANPIAPWEWRRSHGTATAP